MSILLFLSQLLTAALFGSMLFFSCVMAPLIFTRLEPAAAGRFIRAVFPWYYVVVAKLSGLAALLLCRSHLIEAAVMLAVATLALYLRQLLMPAINRLRDRELAGDTRAGQLFALFHRLSVWINVAQLLAVTVVFYLLLR